MYMNDKFSEIARKIPNKIALESDHEGEMSYLQLNQYANAIGNVLLKSENNNCEVIGVCIGRSFSLMASILAIIKVGRAYLPIDSSYPLERINYMVNNAAVSIVVCTEETKDCFDDRVEKIIVDFVEFDEELKDYSYKETDLFCLIYTSGSTGLPNGVSITHQSILNTITWSIDYYALGIKDKSLQVPSCSYTSSVQDYFSTLLSGGTLVMVQENDLMSMRTLHSFVNKYHVTHFDMVPSLYLEYLKYAKEVTTLRYVLVAGEKLGIGLVKKHFDRYPDTRLINEYGMAETSSCFSYYELLKSSKKIYIGKVIDNMNFLLKDPDENGIGELFCYGPGLAKGYYNNKEYTQQKFVMENGVVCLCTGDYVKEYEDGILEYIGRKDNQVKINGKRMNTNEIDYVLQADGNVNDSITVGMVYNKKQIVVSFIDSKLKNSEYFYQILASKLPAHYRPDYIKIYDKFTYLSNSKVNIKKLKEELELELRDLFKSEEGKYAELTGVINYSLGNIQKELNHRDDLREQGIDSISFLKIIAALEEKYDFEIEYGDLDKMERVSIQNLYSYITERINSLKKEDALCE